MKSAAHAKMRIGVFLADRRALAGEAMLGSAEDFRRIVADLSTGELEEYALPEVRYWVAEHLVKLAVNAKKMYLDEMEKA